MIFDATDLAGAVFLFSEKRELIRELNFLEFEALLDNYVPAMDLANRELNAVYIEIDSRYRIRNAVFFLVRFTSQGFVERDWSVPLFHLVQHAQRGPDLGAGPIGLVCASQAPFHHVTHMLWDPDLRSRAEFKAIKTAVQANRLAIHFRDTAPDVMRRESDSEAMREAIEASVSSKLRKQYEKEMRDQMAQAIREQRLRANSLLRAQEAVSEQVKRDYHARFEEQRQQIQEQEAALNDAMRREQSLSDTVEGQAQKIQGLREYFEAKLEKAESFEYTQLNELKRAHTLELEAAVESKTRELRELLQMRDVETQYRVEQEKRLAEQLDTMRRENESLVANSGDQLLSRMLERGVCFVTFQPGAGHITLPAGDISRFMQNPTAYVAEHCGVSEEHYAAWLEHYHMPICQAEEKEGRACGENINRIESPSDFIVGESDCCHSHKRNKTPRLKLAVGKSE